MHVLGIGRRRQLSYYYESLIPERIIVYHPGLVFHECAFSVVAATSAVRYIYMKHALMYAWPSEIRSVLILANGELKRNYASDNNMVP